MSILKTKNVFDIGISDTIEKLEKFNKLLQDRRGQVMTKAHRMQTINKSYPNGIGPLSQDDPYLKLNCDQHPHYIAFDAYMFPSVALSVIGNAVLIPVVLFYLLMEWRRFMALLQALGIARQTLSNQLMVEQVGIATESLKQGRQLAAPLLASRPLVPALLVVLAVLRVASLRALAIEAVEEVVEEVQQAVQLPRQEQRHRWKTLALSTDDDADPDLLGAAASSEDSICSGV